MLPRPTPGLTKPIPGTPPYQQVAIQEYRDICVNLESILSSLFTSRVLTLAKMLRETHPSERSLINHLERMDQFLSNYFGPPSRDQKTLIPFGSLQQFSPRWSLFPIAIANWGNDCPEATAGWCIRFNECDVSVIFTAELSPPH